MAKKAKQSKPSTKELIIAAAIKLFLEQGYRDSNLEDVAKVAGVTKPTVYSHFGSKHGLLLAIVQQHAEGNAQRISTSLQPSGDTAADLLQFGQVFLSRLMSQDAMRWRRLALAETIDHPEIGKAIYAAGPARVMMAMTKYLKQETLAGRLTCDDPTAAAEAFIGMLVGIQPIRDCAGMPMPGKAKQKTICQSAVKIFLAAYGSEATGN